MSFIRTRVESKNFMNRNDRSKYRFTNIILLLLLRRGRFFFLHPKSVGGYRGIVYARYRTDEVHTPRNDRPHIVADLQGRVRSAYKSFQPASAHGAQI